MEKYLLDTHVVLWIGIDPSQISAKAKAILDSNAEKIC